MIMATSGWASFSVTATDLKFLLCYLGSIGTWYMLDEMLHFFKVLTREVEGACFLFITKEDPEIIYRKARAVNINSNQIRVIAAERTEIPLLLSLVDYSIFFIRPGYSKKASSPTKLAESLAMGIPVICNSGVGDSDYFMANNKAGFLLNSFNENEYIHLITELRLRDKKAPSEIRKISEAHFSLTKAVETYDNVYKQLLS